MRVFFRDRPFPTLELGKDSAWFRLPTHVLPTQAVVTSEMNRTGAERFNAFFVIPQMGTEALTKATELQQPLWDTGDILIHGIRRFDIQSKYSATNADIITLAETQRTRVRDWHAMNPYLLNGSLGFARGYPQMHIGHRLRLIDAGSPRTDRTFYIESVDHGWRFGSSIKTSVGVTRGWIGEDQAYLDALAKVAGRYDNALAMATAGS
jgi:hypothetical protein